MRVKGGGRDFERYRRFLMRTMEDLKPYVRTRNGKYKLIRDIHGKSLYHEWAKKGWYTSDISILKIADGEGWSVAHVMAKRGVSTLPPEVLDIMDYRGRTVRDILHKKGL